MTIATPEQTRDRILSEIDRVLRKGAYMAPEQLRSALYRLMCAELDRFAATHGEVISRLQKTLGCPSSTGIEALLAEVESVCRDVDRPGLW